MSPLKHADVGDELDRAGIPKAPLNGDGPPGWESTCPCCGTGGVIRWREGDQGWTCANGCDPSRIADEIHMKASRKWNETGATDALAIDDARRELEILWGLEKVGIQIIAARIVGRGSRASADVYLDDGSEITFESLKDAARPSTLLPELAACVGALPGLKQQQALKGVTLLRRIASHQVAFSEDEIARDWGTSYLQSAEVLDLDMADQVQRWAAFEQLSRREQQLVLRHHDGTRYVRCGWYRDLIRHHDGTASATEIAHRMERVGWLRRGAHGRIKATCPNRPESLVWTFYEVPAGWEDID
jgi:hypothetical protein